MTTIIPWPAGVPSCVMPMSPQGGLRDNRLSFEADDAVTPVERPRTSWAPELYQVTMVPMDRAMFQAFQDWFRGPLAYGSLPFVMDHPITRQPTVWRIVKGDPPYQVSKVLAMRSADVRGISVSFGIQSMPLAVPFDPLSLFASGEQGAWFDPDATGTLFQDHLGATPSAVGQPVGLMLDKSQGLFLGPEQVINGDFADGLSGWDNSSLGTGSIIQSGGRLTLSGVSSTDRARLTQDLTNRLAPGKIYKVSFDILSFSGGASFAALGPVIGNGARGQVSFTGTGRHGFVTLPISGANLFWTQTGFTGSTFDLDNVTARELPGNHARQATTTAWPTLMQSGAVPYLFRDPVDDALPWTAPAGNYDVVHIPLTGPATILTEQALSGAANTLLCRHGRLVADRQAARRRDVILSQNPTKEENRHANQRRIPCRYHV